MKIIYSVFLVSLFAAPYAQDSVEDVSNILLPSGQNNEVIQAVINRYADELFANIDIFSIKHGLDPINLPDVQQEFLGAHITLSNGTLHGISTINRTDNAILMYRPETKIFSQQFPIDLNKIYFRYYFHVKILLVGVHGKIRGTIKDFKTSIEFSFDFKEYNATVNKIDTKGMGPITLTFEGDGIVANVMNVLSKFVTSVLHPMLESTIRKIIVTVSHVLVDEVNKVIHDFLHPNITNIGAIFN